MAKKKLTVLVDESIYNPFVAECNANDFKISEVLLAGIAECTTLISLAVAKREHDFREAKEAQILKLLKNLDILMQILRSFSRIRSRLKLSQRKKKMLSKVAMPTRAPMKAKTSCGK